MQLRDFRALPALPDVPLAVLMSASFGPAPDGRVAVEVFSASGAVEDESALACLLDRLGPPKTV
jgi:hypothetical protein